MIQTTLIVTVTLDGPDVDRTGPVRMLEGRLLGLELGAFTVSGVTTKIEERA